MENGSSTQKDVCNRAPPYRMATHMADMDWSWKLGSLDITLENQRLCVRCDENSEEYVTDTANLMSHIDIILKISEEQTTIYANRNQLRVKQKGKQIQRQLKDKQKGKHPTPTGQALKTRLYNKRWQAHTETFKVRSN